MSRSLSHLRRGLLGVAFTGGLAFGAVEAFAEPRTDQALPPVCRVDEISCRCVTGQYYCFPASGGPCPDPYFCLN